MLILMSGLTQLCERSSRVKKRVEEVISGLLGEAVKRGDLRLPPYTPGDSDPVEWLDTVNARPDVITIIHADWKDARGLVDGFTLAIEALGGTVVEDPTTHGGDSYGFIVLRKRKL